MKAKTLQVVWHSKEPVFSLDFHPSGLLATGGGDKDVKFWRLDLTNDGAPTVRYAGSAGGDGGGGGGSGGGGSGGGGGGLLGPASAKHSRGVNCVRFSPEGARMATGGDGGELYLWRRVGAGAHNQEEREEGDEWRVVGVLRGHTDDVFDLSWAPDGSALASASLENTVLVFDTPVLGGAPPVIATAAAASSPASTSAAPPPPPTFLPPLPAAGNGGRPRARLDAHRHYVQGVAWDPTGACLASASADRCVKIYKPSDAADAAAVGRKKKRVAAAERKAAAEGRPPPRRPALVASADKMTCVATMQRRLAGPADIPGAAGAAAAAAAAAAKAAAGDDNNNNNNNNNNAAPPPTTPLPRLPLFADESLHSFFRRLAWSPDGSCLGVPAGLIHPGAAAAAAAANAAAASAAAAAMAAGGKGKAPAASVSMPPPPPPPPSTSAAAAAPVNTLVPSAPQHAAFLYARGVWDAPAAALPSVKPTVAVRFCPVLFSLENPKKKKKEEEEEKEEKKEEEEKKDATAAAAAAAAAASPPPPPSRPSPPLFDLPYRLVFAVASLDSVVIYDSTSPTPLALLGALHPEPITDVAWSCDGRFLAVSSYDGYCSVAAFAPGELGTPLTTKEARKAAAAAEAEGEKVPDFVLRRVASQAKALAPLAFAAAPATPAPSLRPSAAAGAAAAGAQQQQQQQETGGPRRVVPTPVVAAGAPAAAPASAAPAPAAPASAAPASASAAAPRRIAPTPLGASGSLLEPPSAGPRRIVPQAVTAMAATTEAATTTTTTTADAAANAPTPAARRIAPEPIGAENAAPAAEASKPSVAAPASAGNASEAAQQD